MRTKHEESSMTSGTNASTSPTLPTTIASNSTFPTSHHARRSEIRWYFDAIRLISFTNPLTGYLSLQDLGDLRQLFKSYPGPLTHRGYDYDGKIANSLDEALGVVVQDTIFWARQHEAEGRYRDAEYLFRRASSNEDIPVESVDPYHSEDVLPTLVSVYEKMSDYPAAEMAQETLLRRLFAEDSEEVSDEQLLAAYNYSRLLSLFQKRIIELNLKCSLGSIWSPTYINLFITYRAAVLDIAPLNEVLLDQGLIAFESKKEENCTSLHIAARENANNLARLLIKNGAGINDIDIKCCSPLHIAAEYAEPTMIELLLANGADIEAVDNEDRTPLHAALRGEHAQVVITCLIDAKADTNTTDFFGRTPLIAAIESDLLAIAQLLLEQGANIEGPDSRGETPLINAVRHRKEWAVTLLLKNGANLLAKNTQGYTALSVAVEEVNEAVIRILLDHGARTKTTVDQQNPKRWTILQDAASNAPIAIVETLLEAGANINGRDCNGNTALHRAVEDDHEHVMPLLLMHSTILDAVNSNGNTVLHLAVKLKRRSMILILIRHTEPHHLPMISQIRNKFDQTPLDMARALATHANESSVESSILYVLENALELSRFYIDNRIPVEQQSFSLLTNHTSTSI